MIGYLLRNADVQKELKLSGEQIQKVQQCIQRVLAKFKDEGERARGQGQVPEFRKKMAEETARAIEQAKILQPGQFTRLQQIARQQLGARALINPEVTKILNLTQEQLAAIQGVLDATGEKVAGLLQGKPNEETRQKINAIRKETLDRALAVLSAEQQSAWNDLRGEILEIKFEQVQRGGGGGGMRRGGMGANDDF